MDKPPLLWEYASRMQSLVLLLPIKTEGWIGFQTRSGMQKNESGYEQASAHCQGQCKFFAYE